VTWPAGGLETVPACPVCGAVEREVLYGGLEDRLFGAPGRWTLHRCSGCGCAYLDPRPDRATIGLAYRSYYTHEAGADGAATGLRARLRNGYLNARHGYELAPATRLGAVVGRLSPVHREQADRRIRHLSRPRAGARLLDVGCGNGAFLRAMRAAGWEVSGIDPDPAAVAAARAAGLDVREGELTAAAYEPGSFDAVTLSQVVEHLRDPAAVLRLCFGLLRPGGVVHVATPNLGSRGHRAYGRAWRGLEPPRHLVLFTADALRRTLRGAGFPEPALKPACTAGWIVPSSLALATGDEPRSGIKLKLRVRQLDLLALLAPETAEELVLVAAKPEA
jgi:SAM-dependent methyltransferase